jgi:hypothetical protein
MADNLQKLLESAEDTKEPKKIIIDKFAVDLKANDLYLVGDAILDENGLIGHHISSANNFYSSGIGQIITEGFDIDMYDRELSVQELFKDTGCCGDTRMANRMKYMGLQARMSQDIRARWNAEKFRPYFEEELDDNEHRDWWDNEVEHLDKLM